MIKDVIVPECSVLDGQLLAKTLIVHIVAQLAPDKLDDPYTKPCATETGGDQKVKARVLGRHGFQDIRRG